MTIDNGDMLITLGVILTPFLVFAYYIIRKIHTSALCFQCGAKSWRIEHEISEDDETITDKLIFKCINCGHIRSEYVGRIMKKEDNNV